MAVDWPALPITTAAGSAIGLFVFRDMYVGYWLGTCLLIPWFAWRAGPPEVADATAANLLLAIAGIPETKSYFEKCRTGERQQVASWRELMTSHPAMRGTGNDAAATEVHDSG